ncbi:hypothetical protein Hte_011406 [Hypoxylon texense]
MESDQIYAAVKEHYSQSALRSDQRAGYRRTVAQSFGYTEEELGGVPDQSNLGLSCGNPLAIAGLQEGETVIDIGSGAGFDVFLASKKVGATGRAIGVDMNKDMLALAEKNKTRSGITHANVSFVESRITAIRALDDGIADCVVSNCVVNLVPEAEKQRVFDEMFRLLRPGGGRLAVSDILARKPLPRALRAGAAAYVGCVAGASLVGAYEGYLERAGFKDVLFQDAHHDLNIYRDAPSYVNGSRDQPDERVSCCEPRDNNAEEVKAACCTPPSRQDGNGLNPDEQALDLGEVDLNEFLASYKIYAVKP